MRSIAISVAICLGICAVTWFGVVILWGAMEQYRSEWFEMCKSHGGNYMTYPYKSVPECYVKATGQRIFW